MNQKDRNLCLFFLSTLGQLAFFKKDLEDYPFKKKKIQHICGKSINKIYLYFRFATSTFY